MPTCIRCGKSIIRNMDDTNLIGWKLLCASGHPASFAVGRIIVVTQHILRENSLQYLVNSVDFIGHDGRWIGLCPDCVLNEEVE